MKASEIATALGAGLTGPGDVEIARAVHPTEARDAGDIAVALAPSLLAALVGCKAGAALVAEGAPVPDGAPATRIAVRMSRRTFPQTTALFAYRPSLPAGVHASAVIDATATIAPTARIGPFCDIGAGVTIGENACLVSHCSVLAGSAIGAGCVLHPGVRIAPAVRIGARVLIHANAVIGADGFSFVTVDEGHVETAKRTGSVVADPKGDLSWQKVHSLGGVVIGDDVEIGALTAIDAGTLHPTRLGRGTKVDDLVMIGHNVSIGEDCLLCGNVGVAGSAVIGNRVVLAGGVGVADHVTIADDVVVGATAGVGTNLRSGTVYLGTPAVPQKTFMRDLRNMRRLERWFARGKAGAGPDRAGGDV